MYFKRIFTPGLSHYSYMVGDRDKIAVIDPRRDIEVYIDEARRANKKIEYIFETHRNEDYISGSLELSDRTGATVYISKYEHLEYSYGEYIGEEDEFNLGKLRIKPLYTPGHTLGHLSYILYTEKNEAYMAFVGDTLFWGDIGRTDFYGRENLAEMTGLLYDSIFDKLLSLGDHVLMMPAHGAGSACGGVIEERDYSTVGYERITNPALQLKSKEDFIDKYGYMRLKPPYFSGVEKCNLEGGEYVGDEVRLNSLGREDLKSRNHIIIDIRSRSAYAGKHLSRSLFLETDILSSYLGWLVNLSDKVAFLSDGLNEEKLKQAYWTARRMGYDKIEGVYGEGTIKKLEVSLGNLSQIEEITAEDYLNLYSLEKSIVLDVREEKEIEDIYPFKDRRIIPLQLLVEKVLDLPKDRDIIIICGSGSRSTVAASILERYDIKSKVVSGGIAAIKNQMDRERQG